MTLSSHPMTPSEQTLPGWEKEGQCPTTGESGCSLRTDRSSEDGPPVHDNTPTPSGHMPAHVHQPLSRTCFPARGTPRDTGNGGRRLWCFTHSRGFIKISLTEKDTVPALSTCRQEAWALGGPRGTGYALGDQSVEKTPRPGACISPGRWAGKAGLWFCTRFLSSGTFWSTEEDEKKQKQKNPKKPTKCQSSEMPVF